MAFIEISNLTPAGSDLLAGPDSFLTELQDTDANQIFGGKKSKNNGCYGGSGSGSGKSSGGYGGGSGSGKGGSGSCGYGWKYYVKKFASRRYC